MAWELLANLRGPKGTEGPQGESGPPGEPGPLGLEGPQGPLGEQGPSGPEGPEGQIGPAGPAGGQGPKGESGDPGPEGPQGIQGPEGIQGPSGTGAPGDQGPVGPQGPIGPEGPSGPVGAEGPEGPAGPQGTQGPAGSQGPAGPSSWAAIPDKPATFPSDPHTHVELPTPGQKNALLGANGIPGTGNEYLTKQSAGAAGSAGKVLAADDPSTSDPRPPTAHQHLASDITGLETNLKLNADLAAATAVALVNTPGLSFPVVAGTYYRFRGLIVFRSPALTTGFRLGAVVPAFTVFAATVRIPLAADGSDSEWVGFLTSSGDAVVSTGVQAINTDYLALIDGVILPSANGSFQLQHATEVAGSGVTIRRGSVLSYAAI